MPSRSASQKANSLSKSPSWSSKQSKKSNNLSGSKKFCDNSDRVSNKVLSTRSSQLPPSSKSRPINLGPSSCRSFECSSKDVKEPKTSSQSYYINGSTSNKNKIPMDNADSLTLIIWILCAVGSFFFQIPKICRFAPSACFFVNSYENMIKRLSCLILARTKECLFVILKKRQAKKSLKSIIASYKTITFIKTNFYKT